MPATQTPSTKNYKLNPLLVAAFAAKQIRPPKVKTSEIFETLVSLKPDDVVGEAIYNVLATGINFDTCPGMVELRSGERLPLLVPVEDNGLEFFEAEPQPAVVVPPTLKAVVVEFNTLGEFEAALKKGRRMNTGDPDMKGRTPCAVHINAPKACVCGVWHFPDEMRAFRVHERAVLPIGTKCAYQLTGLEFEPKSFGVIMGFCRDTPQRYFTGKATKEPEVLDTLDKFVAHLRAGRRLEFSQEQEVDGIGSYFQCVMARNGKGLCECIAHSRNMYALKHQGQVFPICPTCAEALRAKMPDVEITTHSFAQARGWKADFFKVGDFDPNHKPKSGGSGFETTWQPQPWRMRTGPKKPGSAKRRGNSPNVQKTRNSREDAINRELDKIKAARLAQMREELNQRFRELEEGSKDEEALNVLEQIDALKAYEFPAAELATMLRQAEQRVAQAEANATVKKANKEEQGGSSKGRGGKRSK